MSLRPRVFHSADELRAAAAVWDDLWRRAERTAPTARAELVALWLEHFAPRATVAAVAIEQEGVLIAALPLVGTRVAGVFELGGLPGNAWSSGGDLLMDPACPDEALDLLADQLRELPWPLCWLEGAMLDAPHWRRFIAAAQRRGFEVEERPGDTVGWIDISQDLAEYESGLSKNLRKNLRRTWQRLSETAPLALKSHTQVAWEQAAELLRRAFEVEDRSWKGPAGTSVLRSAGIFEFFVAQARKLAAWDALEVSFLTLGEMPIAFEYGYRDRGVYYSHKVGYDEIYAGFGPGQLLMWELLKRSHADSECRAIDCLGPLSDAVGKWTTSTYRTGRLVLAPDRLASRLLLSAYRASRARPRQKSQTV